MDWIQFALTLVTFVTLFIWNRTESNSDRRDLASSLRMMHNDMFQEMKDFHGRLERQDAEFKAHLINAHKDAS